MEIHHIVEKYEGGDDTFDNAIPLCFDCHSDMRSYDHNHAKGSKYSRNELKRHRDSWYERVSESHSVSSGSIIYETDKQVFLKTFSILSWSSVIYSIAIRDPYQAIHQDVGRGINEYLHYESSGALAFSDSDLEGIRCMLVISLEEFSNHLSSNTFSVGKTEYFQVPNDWSHLCEKKYNEIGEKYNPVMGDIVSTWKDLLRMGRGKFDIIPSGFIESE